MYISIRHLFFIPYFTNIIFLRKMLAKYKNITQLVVVVKLMTASHEVLWLNHIALLDRHSVSDSI